MTYIAAAALLAIGLTLTAPAQAQRPDAPHAQTPPSTERERALGLEGQPVGKPERPAPADAVDTDDDAAAPQIGQPY